MADVDIEVIRAFSDRVAASYEAAQAYAYCPSSEPYRNHMQKARAAKLHLDAVLDAAAGVALPAKPFPAPGKWFPVDITGTRPMREVSPGKWELAEWPSDGVGVTAERRAEILSRLPEPEDERD